MRRICHSLFFGSIIYLCTMAGSQASAREYLSTGEVAAISGASVGTMVFGHYLRGRDGDRTPLIKGALPLDNAVRKLVGGRYRPGVAKHNFLDDRWGSAATPAIAGILLLATNLSYPQDHRGKETGQDMFLYTSGLMTTGGVTGFFKGLVSRPRPYTELITLEQRPSFGLKADRSSFVSGHTSSAFFSAAYLNLRLRTTMRAEMSADEYRRWRWAPPSLLFGWASFVGLSRVHAHKHYLSDVLAGAAVGYLLAELFFSWGNSGNTPEPSTGGRGVILQVRFLL